MVDWSLVISIVALGLSLLGYIHNRNALANAKKQWSVNRADALFADARPMADSVIQHLDALDEMFAELHGPVGRETFPLIESQTTEHLKAIEELCARLDARLGSHLSLLPFGWLRSAANGLVDPLRSLTWASDSDRRAGLIADLKQGRSAWVTRAQEARKAMRRIQAGMPEAIGEAKRQVLGLPPSVSESE